MYYTLTSDLLNARKVVSGLSLVSGFLTNGSLTAGATLLVAVHGVLVAVAYTGVEDRL